jgi:hypothetical protein
LPSALEGRDQLLAQDAASKAWLYDACRQANPSNSAWDMALRSACELGVLLSTAANEPAIYANYFGLITSFNLMEAADMSALQQGCNSRYVEATNVKASALQDCASRAQ